MIQIEQTITETVTRKVTRILDVSPGLKMVLKTLLFPESWTGRKPDRVFAIKILRVEFGLGLKEAKDMVDAMTLESFEEPTEELANAIQQAAAAVMPEDPAGEPNQESKEGFVEGGVIRFNNVADLLDFIKNQAPDPSKVD